jgi:hypothetical protein
VEKILSAVKEQLPKFNDKALIELRKKELDNAIDFIRERIEEALIIIREDVHLELLEIVPPYERVSYELKANRITNSVNIDSNEMVLVKFVFRFGDEKFDKYLYVPYRFEDTFTIINGTKYNFQLCLIEKIFSRINNGFTIKLLRSPISFWKNKLFSFTTIDGSTTITETAIEVKIYYKKQNKNRNRLRPTLVHYLLCKFGFNGSLDKLDIPRDKCLFVKDKDDDPDYVFFKAQNIAMQRKPILLKVHKSLLKRNDVRRFIVAVLYINNGFKKILYDDLIMDSITVYRVMLGRIIYSKDIVAISAFNYMTDHINSFDSYLDTITKTMFHNEGIMINDIYEMLVYIFYNIDRILLEYTNNNFYNKRFTSFYLAIIDTLVVSLNNSIYDNEKDKNRQHLLSVIKKMLSIFPRRIIKDLYSGPNVRMNPDQYNDNTLLSTGMKLIKQLGVNKTNSSTAIGAPVNKFHPSFVAVESLVGFASSNPSTNAIINPFVEIDDHGGIIKDSKRCEEIDKLKKYF